MHGQPSRRVLRAARHFTACAGLRLCVQQDFARISFLPSLPSPRLPPSIPCRHVLLYTTPFHRFRMIRLSKASEDICRREFTIIYSYRQHFDFFITLQDSRIIANAVPDSFYLIFYFVYSFYSYSRYIYEWLLNKDTFGLEQFVI